MGFVERLDVGNERGIKEHNKATRRMKLPLIKHALVGEENFMSSFLDIYLI